jgi:hypothetical protein
MKRRGDVETLGPKILRGDDYSRFDADAIALS